MCIKIEKIYSHYNKIKLYSPQVATHKRKDF